MLVSTLPRRKASRHLCNLEMGSPPCSAQHLKRKFGYLDVNDRPRNFLTVDELETLFSRQLQIKQVWGLWVLLSENNVQWQYWYYVDVVRMMRSTDSISGISVWRPQGHADKRNSNWRSGSYVTDMLLRWLDIIHCALGLLNISFGLLNAADLVSLGSEEKIPVIFGGSSWWHHISIYWMAQDTL